jgi:lipoprotein-anchoring transpeptidase ErfK/SrfK
MAAMNRLGRGKLPAILVVSFTLALAACGGSGKQAVPTTTTAPPPPVEVVPTFADGATGVALDAKLGLLVKNGKLNDVALNAVVPEGTPSTTLPPTPTGTIVSDGAAWHVDGGFAPNTAYTIAAKVSDVRGTASSKDFRFTTGGPVAELHTTLNVGDDGVYGVGMPVIVQLSHAISADKRAALLERLKVTTTPAVNGAWRWFSDTEVHWRPEVYWATGTKVSLAIDFAGFDAGGGVWGVDGRTVNFGIGDAHVSTVDTTTHQMVVTSNGQVVRSFAVSTGRDDKYPTKSGIHVVNEKAQRVIMDSATVGIPRNSPDGYYEEVFWNVRISNSGEFVHSAPWSVGSQGFDNVSHGCVNAAPADAEWFYNFTQNGDVVQVNGSSEQLQPWNGYGDWQIPFDQWAN